MHSRAAQLLMLASLGAVRLQPPEQWENTGALIITALTFNLFIFHILHEYLLKYKDHQTLSHVKSLCISY